MPTQPLTASQETFWVLAESLPDSAVGNEALSVRMRGPLDRAALGAALEALAQRFDAWRTVIRYGEGDATARPRASVLSFAPFPVEEIALTRDTPEQLERELDLLVRERLQSRIDLARGPAMRITLASAAPDDHLLLFVSQHAAFDGLSLFELLPRVLADAYSAAQRGVIVEGFRDGLSFAAFAGSQSALATDPERPALAWWRKTLEGASMDLELPYDRPRAGSRSHRGARVSGEIGEVQRAALAERASELGVSLSDLLLTIFTAQLHRYAGQTDLLIGVPHGNRTQPGSESLFGCAMLTVPVRCDASGDPTLRVLAERVRAAKRAAFEHLDPAIDAVLRESLARDARESSAGYRAVFSYARLGLGRRRLGNLDLDFQRPDPGWTSVDLSLDVCEAHGRLALTLEGDLDRFERGTLERCLGHTLRLIEDIVARGDVAVAALEILTDAELHDATSGWSVGSLPSERPANLRDALALDIAERADRTAVVCGARTLSYAELAARARALAARLAAREARPGAYVAILLEDPLVGLIAMLATIECGAAFVPLDPTVPAARLEQKLRECAPCAVVTSRALARDYALARDSLVLVDADAEISAFAPPQANAAADDPAYAIFTSGSTGSPKAVAVSQANIVSQLLARALAYPAPPRRMITAHTLASDASLAGILWTLGSGGELLLPEADERRDPVALQRIAGERRATHLDIPPVLHNELLELVRVGELESLEVVIVGGEACSTALAEHHGRLLPNAQLYNEYGPTEATIFSTVYAVPREAGLGSVPIGRPVANSRCYVLDAGQRPLPRGAVGELYLGGEGVALGYLRRPEATAERFLPDPFAGVPGARMYRTGDRVRVRSDGELEFVGRIDRQVKVRGYRIELGEVERALLAIEGVRSAAAGVRQDTAGAHVVAWVVLADAGETAVASLRAKLRELLPLYMVPGHICPIERLPFTQGGKVAFDELPDPLATAERERRPSYVDPRTQTEVEIAEVWSELLGQERVGARDDFFDLGGHSILAVRMLGLIGNRFGTRVSLAAFTREPTLDALAALLHEAGTLKEEPLVVPIRSRGARPPLWMIHPVGGHVAFLKRMLKHLPADLPLMGIQAQGLDGYAAPLETVEAMATLYARLIRGVQPNGPYFLAGHSMGGLVAFEIGQRLRAEGAELGMVGVIDAPGPGFPRRLARPLRLLDRLRFLTRRRKRSGVLDDGMSEYLEYQPHADAQSHPLIRVIEQVSDINGKAADRYVPRRYDGRVHFFRAMQTPDLPGLRFDDPQSGWGPYAAELVVIPIGSDHVRMLDEPALGELARAIAQQLDAIHAR